MLVHMGPRLFSSWHRHPMRCLYSMYKTNTSANEVGCSAARLAKGSWCLGVLEMQACPCMHSAMVHFGKECEEMRPMGPPRPGL